MGPPHSRSAPRGQPRRHGVPEVPTGIGGLPVLPGEDPYDLDRYGRTRTANDWQLWWQFNRDRFLRFSGINTGRAYTGSDGVYLGRGQVSRETIGGRASDALIDTVLSDALQKGIQKGCTNRFSQSALVAMSKVGGEHQRVYDFMTRWYLANGTPEMHPTAAFILGVMGGERTSRSCATSPSTRRRAARPSRPRASRRRRGSPWTSAPSPPTASA